MVQGSFQLFIFPGLLFLFIFALSAEYVDRKLCARLQNRVGPPWFQPLADFIKLLAKEEVVPEEADVSVFKMMPIFALSASITAILYIPLSAKNALYSFNGDVIVVLYLLTIPTLAYFLGGWYSRSVYAMIGAVRSLNQLFAYEVPFFLAILASALLANTWSLSEMSVFYATHHGYWLFNLIGFGVALLSLLGKLEKVPFDIPEAETEIVAGAFTEYGARFLAFFRLAMNVELVVASSLLAAVFLPFGFGHGQAFGFFVYILKVLFIICLTSIARTTVARVRLDQMLNFCWKYLAPAAFAQVLLSLIIKGILVR